LGVFEALHKVTYLGEGLSGMIFGRERAYAELRGVAASRG
jgi:hypothetical protein